MHEINVDGEVIITSIKRVNPVKKKKKDIITVHIEKKKVSQE